MKIGLVLEGGGMRGIYTAGVMDAFLDKNFQVNGIVGVSAGALFGANLPSRQRDRSLRYNLKYLNDKRFLSWHSFLTTGNLVNKEFMFDTIPRTLDPFDNETFKQSPTDFHVAVTNVATGQAEYHRIDDAFAQMEMLRATSALPYVSQMVEIAGQRYLDGGIADSIPLAYAQSLGYDKIIVVLTRPLAYRKSSSGALGSWFIERFYRDYPQLVQALKQRSHHYNQCMEQVAEQQQQGKIFVIRPSHDLAVKRIEKDPAKIQAMYDLGVADTVQAWGDLEKYLAR